MFYFISQFPLLSTCWDCECAKKMVHNSKASTSNEYKCWREFQTSFERRPSLKVKIKFNINCSLWAYKHADIRLVHTYSCSHLFLTEQRSFLFLEKHTRSELKLVRNVMAHGWPHSVISFVSNIRWGHGLGARTSDCNRSGVVNHREFDLHEHSAPLKTWNITVIMGSGWGTKRERLKGDYSQCEAATQGEIYCKFHCLKE